MRTRGVGVALVLILLVAGSARADTIGLYADIAGTNCNIELQSNLTYVHVVHVTNGSTGCAFMAPRPECLTGAIWVTDQCVLPPPACCCGDSQAGMTWDYGFCQSGTLEIARIVYRRGPLQNPCCVYPVLPHPNSPGGQPLVVDCNSNSVPATVLVATVMGDPVACPCGYPVPVEETTWGRVKALYTQ
jgi:hypothetical protein